MDMKSQSADVIIIGGGIGGLMLAAICRKLQISFLVLERSEEITPLGAGISLSPNALRVLDQLGIYDEIRKEGQDVRKMLVYRNSTKWRELDFTRLQDRFGYPVYCIERHVFHELLFKAAGGDEFVRFNEKVVDLVDDAAESFVTVKTESGGEFRGTVVVGADGIRSVTRRLLATQSGVESAKNTIKFTGRVHMSGFTNPIVHLTEMEKGVGCWMLNDGAIMTTWSCKGKRQMYSGAKAVNPNQKSPNQSVWDETTTTTITEVYGKGFHPFAKSGEFSDIINESKRVVASNVFMEIEFPSMCSGRVALLGDAAHSMTTFFGQGACQAIEDAVELTNILEPYLKSRRASSTSKDNSDSLALLLEQYAEIRHTRAKAIATFSSRYAVVHMALLPYGIGAVLRQLLYKWAPVWFFLRCLDWLYGVQPVVHTLPVPQIRTKIAVKNLDR